MERGIFLLMTDKIKGYSLDIQLSNIHLSSDGPSIYTRSLGHCGLSLQQPVIPPLLGVGSVCCFVKPTPRIALHIETRRLMPSLKSHDSTRRAGGATTQPSKAKELFHHHFGAPHESHASVSQLGNKNS
ncbi:hypothetical protein HKD37_18G051436 [Glycine soja]